ncbi:MAG TPA: carbon-nitrogen hydrolase family protein [Verrucomicrobiae bacterium]
MKHPILIALWLLVEAAAPMVWAQEPANEARLVGALDQGHLRLSWEAVDGKLQQASAVTGVWQTVTTGVSPYLTQAASPQKYYRLILPASGRKWLTVAAVTMSVQTNTEANLQTMYSYMELAASNRADLVVFPEIALQQCPAWGDASHKPTAPEMAYVRQTAETIPGPSTSNLLAKAKALGLYVVFGLTEKDEAGLLYNANVFLGPEGLLGKHRKRYLTDSSWGGNEDQIWRPGQAWDVIDSPIGKVGLLICLEMVYYPGSALANQGADLLVTSSAWSSSYGSDYDNGTIGNAFQARRWHVISDQVGPDGHNQSYGHSRVVDPGGKIACDTGAREGMALWSTDLLIDAGTR